MTDPTHPFSDSRSPHAEAAQQPPEQSTLPSGTEPRRRPGRPLLLTQEVHDAIVSAIESGAYVKVAAQAAGVGQSTLTAWLARGREASAAVAAHEEDGLYCPECDANRTTEVRLLRAEQERLDEEHAAAVEEWRAREEAPREPGEVLDNPPPAHMTGVLEVCPSCRSEEYPILWELPDEEEPFLLLLASVTRAQASAEVAAASAWRNAWRDDWRAARDWLARTAPERWAGVTRVQMTTEEAERRIDDAVNEALLAVGIDALDGEPLDDALDEGTVDA